VDQKAEVSWRNSNPSLDRGQLNVQHLGLYYSN
jgi:hypothetical protein